MTENAKKHASADIAFANEGGVKMPKNADITYNNSLSQKFRPNDE